MISRVNRFLQLFGYEFRKLPNKIARTRSARYLYQREYVDFAIKPGDKVLDIGSGGDPFPLATHLCDWRLETSTDRFEPIVIDHRPFYLADVRSLPFCDKSFDFVYCCHILEHVEDPILACKELQRVARRGYVETPTFSKDILFGWARGMHKWHIVGHGATLIFFEYTERQLDGCRSTYWKKTINQSTYHPLQDLFFDNQDIFNVMFSWRDKFCVEVFRNSESNPEVYRPS